MTDGEPLDVLETLHTVIGLHGAAERARKTAEIAADALGLDGHPQGLIVRVSALETALSELRRVDAQTRAEQVQAQKDTNDTLIVMSGQIGALSVKKWYERAAIFVACIAVSAIAGVVILQYLKGLG